MKKYTEIENMVEMTATGAMNERAMKIETTIQFFIKKKPWYLSNRLWKWLLKQLVNVDIADKWL